MPVPLAKIVLFLLTKIAFKIQFNDSRCLVYWEREFFSILSEEQNL